MQTEGIKRNFKKGKESKAYIHGDTCGHKTTRLFRAWHHTKDDGPEMICDEWKNDYAAFKKWAIENGWDEAIGNTHLRRIDVNGGWTPENTEIVPFSSPNCVFLCQNGVTMSISQWARYIGISKQLLWARVFQLKWPVEKALTGKAHGK